MTTFHLLPPAPQPPARDRDRHAARMQAGTMPHGETQPRHAYRTPARPVVRSVALMLCLLSLAGCYGGRGWHDHRHHRDGYYGGGYYGGRGGPPGGGYGRPGRGW
ncbi:hypothetical protein CFR73_07300 [Novacetimonas maltaceti]|uniref:Uncharacterized protein n=1 Tax=Novacetimonas maltaceti TaxID=1203393 RepID=A0A2S3W195_9PROT|nr:hypothetical protein [Novacetimonas maltaceti]POF62323.1 hypothetical protein KMAL_20420 [Novacetimonas maltaceti]PYD60456.1 hypothetical protein CFR73_07300 [Novacetimonas maltaceti]